MSDALKHLGKRSQIFEVANNLDPRLHLLKVGNLARYFAGLVQRLLAALSG
jgi:hypothetical protein